MTKQKKGFLLFICSLVPGAGEMYMGFRKQGISIMTMFWGIIAISSFLNIGFFVVLLPILWCYSFFNVHNLKSLTEEEFSTMEDDYVLHMEGIIGDKMEFLKKYHKAISIGIIVIGVLTLWNCIPYFFQGILPDSTFYFVDFIMRAVPRVLFAFALIIFGIYMLTGKKVVEEHFIEIEEKKED